MSEGIEALVRALAEKAKQTEQPPADGAAQALAQELGAILKKSSPQTEAVPAPETDKRNNNNTL